MQILLVFLSIFFSVLSTAMMSYLAMSTQLGPWVAPIFVVVCMVLAMPLTSKNWFKKYVIVTIAAGSIGGMVGTCLGLTWPAFYFLHERAFELSIKSPLVFASSISLFIFCAGLPAFLTAYFFKNYLIVRRKLPFPMSKLIHDIVYIEDARSSQIMMAQGLLASSAWNVLLFAQRVFLQQYLLSLHMIPMLISIGFVAGRFSTVSLLIGMVSRRLSLYARNQYFISSPDKEFIVTFCSGVFLALIISQVVSYFMKNKGNEYQAFTLSGFVSTVMRLCNSKYSFFMLVGCLVVPMMFLKAWSVSWMAQAYLFLVLLLISYYVCVIVAKIGVIDLSVFVWLILLPLSYLYSGNQLTSVVCVSVFSMLCIGLVVDLLFSYKLAELSNISYERILRYQILGFAVAMMSSGFIVWWYLHNFTLGSFDLLAQSAQEFNVMIQFGTYDHSVVIVGFVFGLIIRLIVPEPLVVVGAMLMPTSVTFWLVFAGAFSYFIKNSQRFYPFWFGVYASHALWMMILALI